MTRASLREYAAVQRERYHTASRAEKQRLLDEVVAVTGIHRKAAIRLLRRVPRPPPARSRAGRPACYGPDVAEHVKARNSGPAECGKLVTITNSTLPPHPPRSIALYTAREMPRKHAAAEGDRKLIRLVASGHPLPCCDGVAVAVRMAPRDFTPVGVSTGG